MLDRERLKKAIEECDVDTVMNLTVNANIELQHTWENGDMEAMRRELQMLIQQMGRVKRDFTPNAHDMIIWDLGKLEGYVAGMRYMYGKKCQREYVHSGISDKAAIKILGTLSNYSDLILHSALANELGMEYDHLVVLMRPFIAEQFVHTYGFGTNCRYIITNKGKNYYRELLENKRKEEGYTDF